MELSILQAGQVGSPGPGESGGTGGRGSNFGTVYASLTSHPRIWALRVVSKLATVRERSLVRFDHSSYKNEIVRQLKHRHH